MLKMTYNVSGTKQPQFLKHAGLLLARCDFMWVIKNYKRLTYKFSNKQMKKQSMYLNFIS